VKALPLDAISKIDFYYDSRGSIEYKVEKQIAIANNKLNELKLKLLK